MWAKANFRPIAKPDLPFWGVTVTAHSLTDPSPLSMGPSHHKNNFLETLGKQENVDNLSVPCAPASADW